MKKSRFMTCAMAFVGSAGIDSGLLRVVGTEDVSSRAIGKSVDNPVTGVVEAVTGLACGGHVRLPAVEVALVDVAAGTSQPSPSVKIAPLSSRVPAGRYGPRRSVRSSEDLTTEDLTNCPFNGSRPTRGGFRSSAPSRGESPLR